MSAPVINSVAEDVLQQESERKYVALFRDRPAEVAETFKELFRSNDKTLQAFMRACPGDSLTARQEGLLWSSGFPLVLLESLTDNRWYEWFRARDGRYTEVEALDADAFEFELVVECLARLLKKVDPKTSHHQDVLKECGRRFPNMWKIIWRYRDVVLLCPDNGAAWGSLHNILELVACYVDIYGAQNAGQAPALDTYAGHIALHFLIRPEDFDDNGFCHPARILLDIIEREGKQALSREHDFLHEAVPSAIRHGGGLPRILAKHAMTSLRTTTSAELQCVLNVLGLLLLWGPPMLARDLDGAHPILALPMVVATVAQRYECVGWGDQLTEPGDIAKAFLTLYAGILVNPRDGSDEQLMGYVVTTPEDLGFAHVVAQSAVRVYMDNDVACKRIIDRFLATYQMVALIGELSYRRDRGCWYSYCYLRRVLQVYWLPTLKELRAAIRPPPQQAPPSAAVRTELQGLHTEWIALGEAFNLSQNSREDDTGLTDYVTAKQLRSGCYFAECLCYGKKPAQKRPRCVCKGCWSVKYCGKRCQKKDWEAGHKDVCSRRYTPANDDK
ncbi:hypothetical protein BC629DRAFT_420319 [Irpex lacteus]|nr:hypothetical protein BC629DRAFT_420319 [Irpex lacteus]